MTLKVRILRCLRRLFIILVSLTMTWFSEKMLISTRCIHGFMSNLIKKSWTDSTQQPHVCFFSPSFGSYWEETWRPIEKGHGLILDLFHRFSIIIIKSRKNSSNANISSPLYTRTQSGDIISDFAFFLHLLFLREY